MVRLKRDTTTDNRDLRRGICLAARIAELLNERSLRMHGRLLLGVLGTVALLAGCSPSDSGITSSVKSKLIADDVVKARDINVDTHDRVVTLTGMVQSPIEESRAIEIARNTRGVADVVDKMSVASAEPGAAPTSGRVDASSPNSVGGAVGDTTIT